MGLDPIMKHPSPSTPGTTASQIPSLRKALIVAGWTPIDTRTSPLAYADASGRRFGTLQSDHVRVALSVGEFLVEERGVAMAYFAEEPTDVILRALIVDSDARGRGLAKKALGEIAALADATSSTLYLEPTPIGHGPVDAKVLSKMYQRAGFQSQGAKGVVMVRLPSGILGRKTI